MKFCKNCGAKRKEGQNFCNSCGHPFAPVSLQETADRTSVQPDTEQRTQGMSKKNKWMLSILAVIAVLAFGVHSFIKSMYTPEKTVEVFLEAVLEQDVEKAKKVIDLSLFLDEQKDKEIKNYLSFLKEHQLELVNGLKNVSPIEEDSIYSPIVVADDQNNELVRLIQADKKLGIYEQYKIEAVPFRMTVRSNVEEAEIEFMEEKRKLKEDLTFTDVLPGNYELIGHFHSDYMKLTEKEEVDFLNAEKNVLNIFLEFEGQYVDVDSNEEDSILFVNGKSTETKIADITTFGPLPTDGSIILHAEYESENGVIKSNETKVINADDVYLKFEEGALVSEEGSLEEFINQYIYTSVEAMNEGDFSRVESFHDREGKSYQESKNYIDYIVSKGIKEDVLSVELASYEQVDNGYKVNTIEEYDIHYADGSTVRKKFSSIYRITVSAEGKYQVFALESTNEI